MSRIDAKAAATFELVTNLQNLGYIIKEFRVNGTVEFHAIPLDGSAPQIARCNDGDDDAAAYEAIDMLASAIIFDMDGFDPDNF